MSKQEQKQMTEEEMKKAMEEHKKAYEAFHKKLSENPDETVTKGELLEAIDFIGNDMGGLAQMVNVIANNMNVLHHNVQQVVQVIQGGQPPIAAKKTDSGIILP